MVSTLLFFSSKWPSLSKLNILILYTTFTSYLIFCVIIDQKIAHNLRKPNSWYPYLIFVVEFCISQISSVVRNTHNSAVLEA